MESLARTALRTFVQVTVAVVTFASLFVLLCLFVVGLAAGVGATLGGGDPADADGGYAFVDGDRSSANRLLAVRVEGVILGSPPEADEALFAFLADATYGYAVQDLLREAAEDQSVKGVLLHLQTPGGTIFGSRAIFDGVEAFQQAGERPVVAWIEGLSASGGVMAMVGADAIFADAGSIIGSIGVLGPALSYFDRPMAIDGGLLGSGIVTEGGIEERLIFAGRSKDLGHPFRRPTAEELAVLQKGIDDEYDAFVTHVASQREIDEALIRERLGAQIFGNLEAEAHGLIDGTLNREQAIAHLAELAGVGDDYRLVRPRRTGGGLWASMLGALRLATGAARPARGAHHDLCETAARLPLAYYGDVMKLCS